VSPRALIMQGFRRFVSTTMVQPSKNSSQLIGRANDEQKDEATHREKFPTLQLQPLDRTRVSIRLEWIASGVEVRTHKPDIGRHECNLLQYNLYTESESASESSR
jgi:hypothetical protein